MANRKGSTLLRVVTVFVVLGIAGGVYFVFSSLFGGEPPIPAEKITPVKRGDLTRSVVATGKIEPVTKVEIKSKASGIIQYLYAKEGDVVKRGQVLLELDRQQLEAALREARSHLLSKKALLEKAEAELRSASLNLERAREEAKNRDQEFAGRDLERMKKLAADRLISSSQLDEAEQRYHSVSVKKSVLLKDVAVKESDFYGAQKAVHQARADVAADEAAVNRSEEDLANATIRSPIDGVVLKRNLEPGDAVSSILQLGSNATLIMTVGDTRELYFKGNVDESDVGMISLGQPVNLTVETFRDKVFPGKVSRISPMGEEKDNVTRFEVRVQIVGDTQILRTNMSANAEVVLERHKGVLSVPDGAVIRTADGKTQVQKLVDRRGKKVAEKTEIKTGLSNGSRVEILSGINEGDSVVLQ